MKILYKINIIIFILLNKKLISKLIFQIKLLKI